MALQPQSLVERRGAPQRHHVVQHAAGQERRHVELQAAGLDLRDVEDVVEDAEQGGGCAGEGAQLLALVLLQGRRHQDVHHADDAVHRGADLVAHRGQELGLDAVRRFRGVARLQQVLVERGQLLAAAVQRELGVAPLDRVVAEHRQRLRHAAHFVVARHERNLPAQLAGREALHQVGHAAERARQEVQRGEHAAEQRNGQRGDGVEDLIEVALFRRHHHLARQAHHDPGDLLAVDEDLGLAFDMRARRRSGSTPRRTRDRWSPR